MYNVIGFVIYKQNCLRTFLFKCSYIEVIFIRRHNNTMKSIREKLNFDPEFQNFILQKPTLSQESLNAYTMTLVNFISIESYVRSLRAYFRMDDDRQFLMKSKQERMRSMHIKRGFVTLEREGKLKLNPIGLWRRLWQALIGCMKD